MRYEAGDLPLKALLPAVARAEDQLARLDEVVRHSPVGQGFAKRQHFAEATASMWVAGELVHIEDLVLHDADRDVRTPTHEITIAHAILRSRRRIAVADVGWALTRTGMANLIGLSSDTANGVGEGEGYRLSPAEIEPREAGSGFAVDLAEIDAVLDRSSRVLETAEKIERHMADPLVVGELVIRDPEWDEDSRLSEWRTVAKEVESLPATLAGAILWDAWESIEPLQRQHWLGAQLVNSYFRAQKKVTSHLFGFNVGLKTIPRDRRRARERASRLLAGLEAMAAGAEVAMKEVIRLGHARDLLERKLRTKRASSSLPGLVELMLTQPIVSSSLIVKELKVSHRAALNLVEELGVREVTGRGSFRAWGLF
ncbi:DUF1403 family protein [Agrobacterium sp. FDAARGOS_525]|uniref:RHE_PE00001 family protein n=1 Tax=Agrobacterium sp. FDAARGOS_525 TaxID=2420311 RepID=UPI000F65EC0E|nr:RHE_PE00001 family protein [Agrobacterium sp. FDAARGOS_525]RSC21448.1 DUF1403 family protein [Agrobacterium sp. FDAARGOS_525]